MCKARRIQVVEFLACVRKAITVFFLDLGLNRKVHLAQCFQYVFGQEQVMAINAGPRRYLEIILYKHGIIFVFIPDVCRMDYSNIRTVVLISP